MVSIDDFIIKDNKGNGGQFKNLYLDKIKKHEKRVMRILENSDSDIFKKFIPMHSYLVGVGNFRCVNTQENKDKGMPCPFCQDIVHQLNKIDNDHFDWLGSLDIINKEETKKFNDDISSKNPNSIKKLIFNNGKVVELGSTYEKEIFNLLTKEQQEIYNSFSDNKGRVEGKMASWKFYIPVFDYATDDVKIYEFSPSIFNQLKNVFINESLDFTSADITVTHLAQKGNWWSVVKKDSKPIEDRIVQKYESVKDSIRKEIERRCKFSTNEEAKEAFKKYSDKLNSNSESSATSEVETDQTKKLF